MPEPTINQRISSLADSIANQLAELEGLIALADVDADAEERLVLSGDILPAQDDTKGPFYDDRERAHELKYVKLLLGTALSKVRLCFKHQEPVPGKSAQNGCPRRLP